MKKKIGNSLSACVGMIAAGLVSENDVQEIRSGIACRTDAEFEEVLARYQALDWHDYPEASNIARRLWRAGKIKQPRLGLFGTGLFASVPERRNGFPWMENE